LISGQYTITQNGAAVAIFTGSVDNDVVIRKQLLPLLTSQEKTGIAGILSRLATLAEGVID